MRRSVVLATAGVIVASGALFWSLRSGGAGTSGSSSDAARPSASTSATPSVTTTRSATDDGPRMPRWTAADDGAAANGLRAEAEAARRESVQTARLPNGTTATLHPTRTVAQRGGAGLVLVMTNAEGKPVEGRGGIEILVVEDEKAPFKAGFIETSPGRYTAILPNRDPRATRVSATAIVSERPLLDDPGATSALSTEIRYAGATLPLQAHAVIGASGVDVALDVSAPADQRIAIRAELRDETGAVHGEAIARGEGHGDRPTEIVLSFAIPDIGTRDVLATRTLYLADATLFAGEPLRWTDFRAERVRIVTRRR